MRLAGGLAGALIAIAVPAAAQGPGAEGPIILHTHSSVREAGLNGAGAALVGDAGAVFHNPAGLATIGHIGLEGGYFQAPFDAYQTTAAFAWRLRQFHFGGGIKYFDFGAVDEIIPDVTTGGVTGTPTGVQVDASEFLAVGTLVYRFGLLAFGGSAKYVRQRVVDTDATGLSGDFGVAVAFFDIMAIGFAVQNLSGNWKGDSPLEIPRLTRTGFTMNYVDPQETFRLMSTVELQWPEGRGTRLVLGVEGGIVVAGVGILGRTAYGSRREGSDRSAFTFGLSLGLSRLMVDYAYEPSDLLGDASQRIGVRLTL